ncbi:hypothetical protein G9A89_012799 [Geosiphon pyriformis]|nr:hypothetical protein G9A89_012799 [Geosiphon pyriformis]
MRRDRRGFVGNPSSNNILTSTASSPVETSGITTPTTPTPTPNSIPLASIYVDYWQHVMVVIGCSLGLIIRYDKSRCPWRK